MSPPEQHPDLDKVLKKAWSKVLDLSISDIRDDLDFFKEAGGDSVLAVKLSTSAQESGIGINVQQVFQNPTFGAMKAIVNAPPKESKSQVASSDQSVGPVSRETVIANYKLIQTCLDQSNVDGALLQDIRRCTPFQEELMRASHDLGCWTFQLVLEISRNAESRVREIIDTLHWRNPTFRTRICQAGTELYQIFLNEIPRWDIVEGSFYLERAHDFAKRMCYGDPLSRCTIIRDGEDKSYVLWTQNHAIYDRWSKMNITSDIHEAFKNLSGFKQLQPRPPVTDFLDCLDSMDTTEAVNFWKEQLDGYTNYRTLFDVPPNKQYKTAESMTIRKMADLRKPKGTHITHATVAQLAWALVLAKESKLDDVFFCLYRSSRQIDLRGIDSIIGPLWTLIPSRTKVSADSTLSELLNQMHDVMTKGIPYEPFGPQALNEHFGHKGFLQSALLVQPPQPESFNMTVHAVDDATGEKMQLRSADELVTQTRNHIGLYVTLTPKREKMELWMRFDETILGEARAHHLGDELISMIDKILDNEWDSTTLSALEPGLSHLPSSGAAIPPKLVGGIDPNYKLDLKEDKPWTLQHLLSPRSMKDLACTIPGANQLSFTYEQLDSHITSFQTALSKAGITHGSAVSMSLGNTYEIIVAFQAAARQRAIAAPLNPGYKKEEFEFYIDDLGSSLILLPKGGYTNDSPAVLAARTYSAAIAEVYYDLSKNEVILDMKESGKLEGESTDGKLLTAEEDDIALVLHTSGTTGRPKAVPLTHRNLVTSTVNISKQYQLRPEDRTMLIMPLFHVHGLLASFLAPLRSGGSAVIPDRLTPDFWTTFKNNGATWYSATPTMHRMILSFPIPKSGLPYIRFIRSCSSQLPPVLMKQLIDKFHCPVVESYAMTEASHMMTSNPLGDGKQLPGSVGQASHVDLKIMDDDGNELPQGKAGEVCVKGGNVTKGYLNNPAANKSGFTKTGYFRTGDQGMLNEDGYLILTGRLKEMINKGGEKVSPIELDNVISQHEAIQECVSFGVDDEDYGQEVAAAIKLKDGQEVDVKNLKKWIAERIAAFKVPRKLFIVEEIPKTATGKVQRKMVAEKVAVQAAA